jgi:AAA family ATP:ADP antiporter
MILREERPAALVAFVYMFVLLGSFGVLRPVRDAMATASGVKNLPWLFTGTFVSMLVVVPIYAALTRRVARSVFIPIVYRVFAAMTVGFFVLLRGELAPRAVAPAFYVWVSVYNVFVVSVFWSFMADVFRPEQAKRLFGFVAAGGTCGMIAGPLATAGLVELVGAPALLLVTALLLELSVWAALWLHRWARRQPGEARGHDEPVAGTVLEGFLAVVRSPRLAGIAVHVFLYSLTSTFLYAEQQRLVAAAADDVNARAAIFAQLDLVAQLLTLALQMFVVGQVMRRLGIAVALVTLPLVTALGSGLMIVSGTLAVVTYFNAARRATQYALERPARESIFAAAGRDVKYRSKNFMDTVVFRGGDWLSIWVHSGLGLGLTGVATLLVPVSLAWAGLAVWIGRKEATP